MSHRRFVPGWLALFTVIGAGTLVGCGEDGGNTGASGAGGAGMPMPAAGAGTGAPRQDAAAGAAGEDSTDLESCSGELPVMTVRDLNTNTVLAPDWSCYDGAPADAAADLPARTAAFRLPLASFNSGLVEGVAVDFFFGPSTLGTPALTRAFDGSAAMVRFDVPAGASTVSARVHGTSHENPSYDIVEMREYGFPIPADGSPIDGYALIRDSLMLAISLATDGERADPDKALIVSWVRDCSGRPVGGAQFELLDGDTGEPVPTGTSPDLPRSSYSDFGLPTTTCTFTSTQQSEASWMMVNAPVNVIDGAKTHSYRLRLAGRMQATDLDPVILGESELELFAGLTTVVRLYR